MPKIRYQDLNFRPATLKLISQCDAILTSYSENGWDGITLRQLYYQLVAKNVIPNTQPSYHLLGINMNNARVAGLIDWNHIIDRARSLRGLPHHETPNEAINHASQWFHLPWWEEQKYRPEIWVEKDALIGVAQRAGNALDVPFYACKGYNSQSQMWAAAQRFIEYSAQGKKPIVFYAGDHDPSGVDMSRDVLARLTMFGAGNVIVQRVALNYEQVEELKPPPNPAKVGDSRYSDYVNYFGTKSCWELDAIDANELVTMLTTSVEKFLDMDLLNEVKEREQKGLTELALLSNNYQKVIDYLHDEGVSDMRR